MKDRTSLPLHALPRASRLLRVVALAVIYAATLASSLALALLLRFDFDVPPDFWARYRMSAVWIIPLKLGLLAIFGQFRSLLTFFSLPEAKRLALAMGASALIETAVWFAMQGQGVVPRGVIVTDLLLSFVALAGLRTLMRTYREARQSGGQARNSRRKRALIAGAGTSGAALLRELLAKPGTGVDVVGFLDDDPAKVGSTLHTVPVLGFLNNMAQYAARLEADKVIIALPSAPASTIKALVTCANEIGLEHDILPSVAQLLHQRVTVSHLRPVEPEDLLGRPAAILDDEHIRGMLADQTILVTGAGGSIGSELCRQIAARSPATLILIDRSEPALFAIEHELRETSPGVRLVPLACDILDEPRLTAVFRSHRPVLVFHAAAHKHVPLMESQPATAILNNALGTLAIARAASNHDARKLILISTDKAMNPASVMGATKRLAEKLIREIDGTSDCACSAVRFGNVLGSSGSVVTIFHRQIAAGGPLTVTHEEATRYFMSIPEAVGLILQSAHLAAGGEVFALEMGDPIRVVDLARQMIELSGFAAESDIAIKITGLRAGEKLHEECAHRGPDMLPTPHSRINKAVDNEHADGTADALIELLGSLDGLEDAEVLRRLQQLVPTYSPVAGPD